MREVKRLFHFLAILIFKSPAPNQIPLSILDGMMLVIQKVIHCLAGVSEPTLALRKSNRQQSLIDNPARFLQSYLGQPHSFTIFPVVFGYSTCMIMVYSLPHFLQIGFGDFGFAIAMV